MFRPMLRIALIGLAVAIAIVAASAARAREQKPIGFRMPSKNIACAFFNDRMIGPPSLRCDVLSGLKPRPSRRCRFEGDWSAVTMNRLTRARPICISDTVYDKRAPILRYGTTWRKGGFTCKSRRAGLSCHNLRHHGFFLSRSNWRVY
jgi:hypothetical protein